MVQIKIAPITAALLAGTAAAAYAQVGMAQTPGNVAPGDLGQLNRLNPNSGSPATGSRQLDRHESRHQPPADRRLHRLRGGLQRRPAQDSSERARDRPSAGRFHAAGRNLG